MARKVITAADLLFTGKDKINDNFSEMFERVETLEAVEVPALEGVVKTDTSDLPGFTSASRVVYGTQSAYDSRTPPADDSAVFYNIVGSGKLVRQYLGTTLIWEAPEAAAPALTVGALAPVSETEQDGGEVQVSLSASGGVSPYTFSNPSLGAISGSILTIPLDDTFNGSVTFTVTDAVGATATGSISVAISAAPVPGTGPDDIVAVWGQSEISNLYGSYEEPATGETYIGDDGQVEFWWSNRGAGTPAEEVRSHVMTAADGYNSRFIRMANAWVRQNPGRTVAIVFHTAAGTNFDQLVDDSVSGRDWFDEVALHDAVVAAHGRGPEMVLFDWQGSPSTYGGDYGKALHQILFGETFDGTSIGTLPATVLPGHPREFVADHIFSELYDWTQTKVCVLEPHRFESNSSLFNQVRDDRRRMYAQTIYPERFIDGANAVLSYGNGKDDGSGVVDDSSHPRSGEGSRRYGEGLVQAAMQALGLRPQPHVEIDNCYWEPSGDYVEVWSSHGPMTAIDPSAVAGMKLSGALYDGEITPTQRLRLTAATVGRQLTDADTLEVLPNSVGQTGALAGDSASRLDLWKRMPLVRTAPGATAIPDAVRAGAIIATTNGELESAIESATGGEHIIVPAGTDLGDLRINGATPASEVTIWSDGIGAARMSQIYATGCDNLTFRNFLVEREWDAGQNIVIASDYNDFRLIGNIIRGSKYPHDGVDYTAVAAEVMNGVSATGGTNTNFTMEGNYVGGLLRSLQVQADGLVRLAGNMWENCYEDHIRISPPSNLATSTTEIVDNFQRGVFAVGDAGVTKAHSDFVQFLGSSRTENWPNITISRNVTITDSKAQGYFLDDLAGDAYFIPTIEDNLVVIPDGGLTGSGIKVGMIGDGSVVRNNTLTQMNPDGSETDSLGILLGVGRSTGTVTVEDNITDKLVLLGDATYAESGNVVLGLGGSTIPYDDVFGTGFQNPTVESFNEIMLRFVGRGDYAGIGADQRSKVSILLDGIPVANDPAPEMLVNTVSDTAPPPVTGSYAIDGTHRLREDRPHETLTTAYVFEVVATIDGSTNGFGFLVGDSGQRFFVGCANNGNMRSSAPMGLQDHNGAYSPGVEQTFRIGIDPAGTFWVSVNGTVIRNTSGATPFQWDDSGGEPIRDLQFFNRNTDNVLGSISRVRIWKGTASAGQIPAGTPYKDIDGGEFLADAAAAPRFNVTQGGTLLN